MRKSVNLSGRKKMELYLKALESNQKYLEALEIEDEKIRNKCKSIQNTLKENENKRFLDRESLESQLHELLGVLKGLRIARDTIDSVDRRIL